MSFLKKIAKQLANSSHRATSTGLGEIVIGIVATGGIIGGLFGNAANGAVIGFFLAIPFVLVAGGLGIWGEFLLDQEQDI